VDNLYAKRVTARKDGKTYTYIKLVHAYRQGGRVGQRLAATLGREDELKASGQLERRGIGVEVEPASRAPLRTSGQLSG
jgi:hypothetical protein